MKFQNELIFLLTAVQLFNLHICHIVQLWIKYLSVKKQLKLLNQEVSILTLRFSFERVSLAGECAATVCNFPRLYPLGGDCSALVGSAGEWVKKWWEVHSEGEHLWWDVLWPKTDYKLTWPPTWKGHVWSVDSYTSTWNTVCVVAAEHAIK